LVRTTDGTSQSFKDTIEVLRPGRGLSQFTHPPTSLADESASRLRLLKEGSQFVRQGLCVARRHQDPSSVPKHHFRRPVDGRCDNGHAKQHRLDYS
jgi:hypothetical protein